MSMVTKDRILGKAWEAQLTMLVVGKKCWAGKMAIQALALRGGRFSAFGSTIARNGASACSNSCTPGAPSRFSPHNVECKKGET